MGSVGVDLGAVWYRFWVGLASVWDRFGVDFGSIWDRFGIGLGSILGRFGVGLVSLCDQFGIDLGSVRGRFGIDLVNLWKILQVCRNFVRKGIVRKGGPIYGRCRQSPWNLRKPCEILQNRRKLRRPG